VQEILEKYDDCINEMNSIIEREIFRSAFSIYVVLYTEYPLPLMV